MFARTREDIAAVRTRDPAARGAFEIWLTYSGMHAVWGYRFSHWLWTARARFLARAVSQYVRFLTGVEIHPAAELGRRVIIDHGSGVVIGETAIVGDDVLIYHGVTLGGTSSEGGKRHPTLGSNVVVGAGAAILGDITLGSGSVVGAGAVVVADAPEDSLLVGVPAVARPKNGTQAPPDSFNYTDPAIYI
ncbi:Serine acetyltransferase [Leifsonia rubra CMS 76R]|uniref:Serine acetyltransferase n=1 Tax=Rhodoglobus vestalii TaxID=193384 RepID=A0A8H2PU81_9MICO|nr:serine O-acetyltransferase [Rhodoglobus vestalii]EPR77398.1 Serine acetyltransferase [Leifsonia rubra CMS 76R]TQO20196.1 serine O-acetyltransferase [Rhodoglobus vestalii]